MFNVIPAIDILDGKVVRLTQGDYGQVEWYSDSPVNYAKRFVSEGAQRIHIVDLNGAKDGRWVNQDAVESIRASVTCELEFGGGVRTLATADRLISLGLDYIVLGSLLVQNPDLAQKIVFQFPQKVIIGLDTKDGMVALDGWTEKSTLSGTDLLSELKDWPAAAVIFTDIARDGMMSGPNLTQLRDIATHSPFPVIASGGVSSPQDVQDIRALERIGVEGCIVGKAVLSGQLSLKSLINCL